MHFKIKKTSRKGQGVFTTKPFKKGDLVHVFAGDRLTSKQIDKRIEAGFETCDDPFQISRTMYIDLDELSRSINHSCDPNCGIKQELKLFAIRDIAIGEEICFDYSTTVPQYKSWWKMKCFCKSLNCRKVISSFNKIPKKHLDYYLKLQILPLWVRKFRIYDRYS